MKKKEVQRKIKFANERNENSLKAVYSFHTELNCAQCHIGNGKLRIKLLLKTPFWQENNEKGKKFTLKLNVNKKKIMKKCAR